MVGTRRKKATIAVVEAVNRQEADEMAKESDASTDYDAVDRPETSTSSQRELKTMTKFWLAKEVEMLELWEDETCLYRTDNTKYRDADARQRSLKRIATAIDIDSEYKLCVSIEKLALACHVLAGI